MHPVTQCQYCLKIQRSKVEKVGFSSFCRVYFSKMLVLLVLIVVLSSVVFSFIQRQYSYWQRHKIPFIKPKFPFGSISAPGTNKTIGEQFAVFYENHRRSGHAFVGIYASVAPVALLIDLELIGRVLIRDFDCFQNRGKYYNEKDPLSETLVNVDHAKWKPLREKCSKVFTPLKMRYMYPTMVTVCDRLVDCLSKMIKTDSAVEVHNLFARCVTDTIGNCAFGIDVDSLEDPAVKFRQMAKKAYDEPKLSFLQLSCVSTFPKLARFFDVREQHKDVADYFSNIVRKTMQYRETNDIRRNDFMDILMQMRNRSSKKESENFTMTEIAAQAYTFITVGFEGPSLTLAYCLYELSLDKNKHIQEKAGAEIESVLKRHNGNLTYEAVAEMAYCERIVKGFCFRFLCNVF